MKKTGATKRIWISMAVLTAWFVAADTFGQAEKVNVSLAARTKIQKEKYKGEDEVENANSLTITSFKRQTEVCTLTITLKNTGDQPVKGQLDWGFISDQSSGRSRPNDQYSPADAVRAMYSPGKKVITLPAGEEVTETIISDPFVFEEKTVETESYVNNGTSSRDYETGNVYKGYLILFTVNGEIVATKASSSSYAKDEWVQKLKGF